MWAGGVGRLVPATVGVRGDGEQELLAWLDSPAAQALKAPVVAAQEAVALDASPLDAQTQVIRTHQQVHRLMELAVRAPAASLRVDDRIDAVVLHPVWGMLLLLATLFLMFQAVFTWASVPTDWINAGVEWTSAFIQRHMADGPLRSLLVDGIVAGTGGVLVFLPQILTLFLFILALEDSGYVPRAACLLDRGMGTVGLSGRSFIPLLSGFACAVPGVMATRSITHWRDRLVTIMIAPLMTCSAR